MLYTERLHFFHRYKIRGIRNIVFYGLPTYSNFYTEMLNLLEEAGGASQPVSSVALYSRSEALELERIVGSNRSSKMLQSDKSTHLFC
jgi:U3 small nucleolar RNA-associated protein 25